jgi:hypothetical protein
MQRVFGERGVPIAMPSGRCRSRLPMPMPSADADAGADAVADAVAWVAVPSTADGGQSECCSAESPALDLDRLPALSGRRASLQNRGMRSGSLLVLALAACSSSRTGEDADQQISLRGLTLRHPSSFEVVLRDQRSFLLGRGAQRVLAYKNIDESADRAEEMLRRAGGEVEPRVYCKLAGERGIVKEALEEGARPTRYWRCSILHRGEAFSLQLEVPAGDDDAVVRHILETARFQG